MKYLIAQLFTLCQMVAFYAIFHDLNKIFSLIDTQSIIWIQMAAIIETTCILMVIKDYNTKAYCNQRFDKHINWSKKIKDSNNNNHKK